ncbi:hypothetical protein [Glycomyces arizonensis]|uniref:hypothetical protein n=1 Tax=Glycomyces arizonensis TaxID=256035 RepID=UPI000421AB70|nr:hypothetical protein [Glycomyces arizonensis]
MNERAERAHRGAEMCRKAIAEHRRVIEPEPEPGVSETLRRAREVARAYKRDRDRPRPLADITDVDPAVLVDKFKHLPERSDR